MCLMCIEGVALLIVKGKCIWLYRGKVEEGLRRRGGDDKKQVGMCVGTTIMTITRRIWQSTREKKRMAKW